MRLGDLIESKGRLIYAAHPRETVLEAVKKLVSHNVGALVVLDDSGKLVGIITERDILRLAAKTPLDLSQQQVKDHMTRDLVTATSNASTDDAQAVMTERRIRHLPIVDDNKLQGLISMGDLVKIKLEQCQFERGQLTDFVLGKYPA